MQMKVLVGVAVIERQPGCLKGRELRGDFIGELPARLMATGDERPDRGHVRTERPLVVYETTHGGRRKNGTAFDQNYVQADAQGGQAARACYRVCGRRGGHHQARCRQYAVPMPGLDGLIHFCGGTEVVRRHDQTLQAVSRRVRRKRKNSTPSRRRRFIISGLAIISPTIEAILEGRK